MQWACGVLNDFPETAESELLKLKEVAWIRCLHKKNLNVCLKLKVTKLDIKLAKSYK